LLSNASNDYIEKSLNGRCDQIRLTDSLHTLLGLYFIPNESDAERARQIAVFVLDLADMSEDCVWWAIREWRRTETRRPTPAGLRQLAMMRRHEASKRRRVPVPPTLIEPPRRDTTMEERKEILAKIAKDLGLVKGRDEQWTLPSDLTPAPRVPHWSEGAKADDPRYAALRKARAENALMTGGGE
jgi:hypothetical protein